MALNKSRSSAEKFLERTVNLVLRVGDEKKADVSLLQDYKSVGDQGFEIK
jgi:hypothetical protein